ncbi:MAG: helix-turn-helix transcriptional regulator [Clostridia bacterium]|nr:helix-turn-helix transcriptional regulator [Clostridia bacterium]
MNNNIREIREQQGIKQYALAKMTGLSEGYICHLERGTRDNPTYNVMEKIAKALHKEVKDVFNI